MSECEDKEQPLPTEEDAKRFLYKIEQYAVFMKFSPEILLNTGSALEAEVAKRLWAALTVAIRADIPVRELMLVRWPKTWWDAVKARWFSKLPWVKVEWASIQIEELLDKASMTTYCKVKENGKPALGRYDVFFCEKCGHPFEIKPEHLEFKGIN